MLTPDNSSTESSTVGAQLEFDEDILIFFDWFYNKKYNGGCSDQDGDEVNLYSDAIESNIDEQALHNKVNDLDAEKEGVAFTRVPGASGGWLPHVLPGTWEGCAPKYDAPS